VSNHYETLGVAQNATPEQLKAAFRKLAKEHHPDLGGDVAKFQKINEAYETLSDPDKKAHYDYQRSNPNHGMHHDPDPFGFGFSHPINDIFNEFSFTFGPNGFQGRPHQQQRNKNLRIVYEMELLDTLHEQTKVFDIRLSNGKETIELKIPAGIGDGQVVGLKGKGDNEHQNLPRGNLEIVIKIKSHPVFTRQDDNIVMDVTIDCFDALIGKDVELDLPSSKRISMRIPAGTQMGTIFGISDEGFPTYPKFTRGKLLVRVNVLIPKTLTPDQIILVKEIQKKQPVNS